MSLVLSGRVKMLAMLAVPDTVPSRTNMGLRPRDERRAMILLWKVRYEDTDDYEAKSRGG